MKKHCHHFYLKTLEEVGVYVENLGECLQGTVFTVVADNFAAHGLAGFNESFRSTYLCRFCHATQTEIQTENAVTGNFDMRTKDFHNDLVHELQTNGSEGNYGIKISCVLSDHLSFFHPVTGFPPDLLHDLVQEALLLWSLHFA